MSNIILIGMPGAGKSTLGVQLAKDSARDFVDTDVLIQLREHKTLQQIIDGSDYLHPPSHRRGGVINATLR